MFHQPAQPRSRFAARRVAKGLGQDELAHRTLVSRSLVQRFERGEVPLPIISAVRLARELGTTVDDLFADAVIAADAIEKKHARHGKPLGWSGSREVVEGVEGAESVEANEPAAPSDSPAR